MFDIYHYIIISIKVNLWQVQISLQQLKEDINMNKLILANRLILFPNG